MSADDIDDDFTPDATEARAIAGRAAVEKRWAKHRAARIAAGLPATRDLETQRAPRFLQDPAVERWWLSEAKRLGLDEGKGRTALRVQAKRLADAAARELARYFDQEGPVSPVVDDDALLLDYYEAEAIRWRRRAERDRAMAEMHDDMAHTAEQEVARLTLHLRGGAE